MSWRLDILGPTLVGHGHRVELGKVGDTRGLYALFTEAAAANLPDVALGELVRRITSLLPPGEILLRADKLTADDTQVVIINHATHRPREPRANARAPIFVTAEAAP